MYLAPPYFVYLLRAYCFPPSTSAYICDANLLVDANDQRSDHLCDVVSADILSFPRLATLGSLVIGIFALSLAPFLTQLPQLASRLFPFTRGLNHAYWAPNAWALVTVLDRLLLKCARPSLRHPSQGWL
jgi:alpha-1,3-glucosyltransferase